MKLIILVFTATTTALMAGLFFAWSCSVTLGLARVADSEYISAMQWMNREIQNPLFFICFMGTAILLPLNTYLFYTSPASVRFWLLAGASLVYLVGVMGVTIFGNVPLNESLDSFHLWSASAKEIAAQRLRFEGPWNKLNNIRTVASTITIVLVILACIDPQELTSNLFDH